MTPTTTSPSDRPSDYDVVAAMRVHGGAFAQHLAGTWVAGDARNRDRIKAAFPDIWERYRDHAARRMAKGA